MIEMVQQKRALSPEDIEAQAALELPARELPLIFVNLLNDLQIVVPVALAANLCGVQTQVLTVLDAQYRHVECTERVGVAGINVR
jgi:hypothetical protein